MMEVTLFFSGILLGVFAGLMPGIGVFTTLILIYPLLLDLTISQLLILYIPLISISQYLGSVPALYFKIPGESTSFIATEYGYPLFHKGHYDLIPLTAIGSFVATLISAFIIACLPFMLENFFYGAGGGAIPKTDLYQEGADRPRFELTESGGTSAIKVLGTQKHDSILNKGQARRLAGDPNEYLLEGGEGGQALYNFERKEFSKDGQKVIMAASNVGEVLGSFSYKAFDETGFQDAKHRVFQLLHAEHGSQTPLFAKRKFDPVSGTISQVGKRMDEKITRH